MLINVAVAVVKAAKEVRRFHEVLVDLRLIAGVLVPDFLNLLLGTALTQGRALAGAANQ